MLGLIHIIGVLQINMVIGIMQRIKRLVTILQKKRMKQLLVITINWK